MRPRAVAAMLRKELLETLRDRRTLFAMIGVPIIVYPLLFIMGTRFAASEIQRRETFSPAVAVWGPVPEPVVAMLGGDLGARVVDRLSAPPPDAEAEAGRLIRSGTIHLALIGEPGGPDLYAADGTAPIRVVYNRARPLSDAAYDRVAEGIERLNRETLERRISVRGLPQGFSTPIDLVEADVATPEERGGSLIARILPYLLLVMVTLGAMYPAIDVTAGEKERGTMQTLLTAPVRPVEIVAGKYLSVVAIAIASALLNVGAMRLAFGQMSAIGNLGGTAIRFALGPGTYLKILGLLLPAAFLVAALLMAITVFARSFREGQNYLSPVFLIVIFASFLSFGTTRLTPGLAVVPLVNIAMATRDLLNAEARSPLLLVFLSSTVYAALAVLVAARVFENEQVLLGGERPWRDLVGRRMGSSVPTGRGVVGFSLALLVLFFYGSIFAAGRLDFAGTILFTQIFLLITPAVGWLLLTRRSLTKSLFLSLPSRGQWPGIILLAAGGWAVGLVINIIQTQVFGGAAAFIEQFERLLRSGLVGLPLWGAIMLLALLPAFAEEVCFRGVVLSGLRSSGTATTAVVGSAVLFGLFHLDPFRILPAAGLGILLAIAVLATRSILAGVVIHAATNTLPVLALRLPAVAGLLGSPAAVGAGLVLAAAGVGWLVALEKRATVKRRVSRGGFA